MTIFPIVSHTQLPDPIPNSTRRDVYRIFAYFAILIVSFSVVVSVVILLPNQANAFWPFSSQANAATSGIIPSSSTPALSAPLNSNVNTSAPVALATSGNSALMAYSGPAGTIADVSPIASSDQISVYVVRPGDTLSEIANMFNVSINTVIWANDLSSARDVHPGDTLIILPVSGIKHTIIKRDSLRSLAKRYHSSVKEIATYNGIDASATLTIGSVVIIPGGEILTQTRKRVRRTVIRGTRVLVNEPYLGGSGRALNGYFVDPLPGGRITQGIHGWNAVDIGARRGTPIYAAASGRVIITRNNGRWNGGYGNYVVITHKNGIQTLYSHMTYSVVSPGQSVTAGQIIGHVGATGMATGPHLHFEVRGAANPFRNCSVGSFCSPQ